MLKSINNKILDAVSNPLLLFTRKLQVIYLNNAFYNTDITIKNTNYSSLGDKRRRLYEVITLDAALKSKIENFMKNILHEFVYLECKSDDYWLHLYRISKKKYMLEIIEKTHLGITSLKKIRAKIAAEENSELRTYLSQQIHQIVESYNEMYALFLACTTYDQLYLAIETILKKICDPDSLDILLSNKKKDFVPVFAKKSVIKSGRKKITSHTSTIIGFLQRNKHKIIVKKIEEGISNRDLSIFPGLSDKDSAIFLPFYKQDAISGLIIISFLKNHSFIDDILTCILIGVAHLIQIIIEKIKYSNDQSEFRQAFDRYGKLTSMGRIIAGVAHEVNNPLSIMQLDIDELKSFEYDASYKKEILELLNSLQEEIVRMTIIVKQLKDYAKPDDAADNSNEYVNVSEVFKRYPVKILLKNMNKKKINVKMNIASGNTAIPIPYNRIIQVLMNVFSNADDAVAGKDNAEIKIHTFIEVGSQRKLVINIEDNGIGISQENLQQIFEPFFTTKKGEGTGLGLSISYSIVKRYGGDIEVVSKRNKGTRFSIVFPLSIPEEESE